MTALEQARDLLPAWVGWAPLVYLPVVALLSWAFSAAAAGLMLRPLRKLGDAHWTERARLAFPARAVAMTCVFVSPGVAAPLQLLYSGPVSRIPPVLMAVLSVLCGALPALLVALAVERHITGRKVSPRTWTRSVLSLWLVVIPNAGIALLSGILLPGEVGWAAGLGLLLTAAAMTAANFGAGLWVARRLGLARPASSRLQRLVEEVATAAGIAPRAVYDLSWGAANALAFPLTRTLVFTERAVELLGDDELRGVTAHEFAHLAEPRGARVTRLGASYSLLLLAAAKPLISTYGLTAYVVLALIYFAVIALVTRLFHRLEVRADAAALLHQQETGSYARALEQIHTANLIPGVLRGRGQVHPHLYDRLLAAGVQPDYPRPQPPPRLRSGLVLVGLTLTFLVSLFAPSLGLSIYAGKEAGRTEILLLALAVTPGDWALGHLASVRYAAGDVPAAVTLYRAQMEVDGDAVLPPSYLALVLAEQGRCEEARAAYREALARQQKSEGVEEYEQDTLEDAQYAVDDCSPVRD